MTAAQTLQRSRVLALVAGGLDFGTGLGMVFLPGLTLALMRVPVPAGEALVYGRFVGVFVAAVGFSYLWALRWGTAEAVRGVLRFTIPFRVGAGSFCLVAVATGALAPWWLSVTVADYALVGLQGWLLRGAWEVAA